MPELPEVETLRLQLDRAIKGLRISEIQILKSKSFVGEPKEVIGKKVVGVQRRAKITLIRLENGFYLAIHLKLTGQLIYRKEENKFKKVTENNGPFAVGELPNKFTRIIISFDNGGRLYFNDMRIFGWIKVIRNLQELGEEKLGPEANDDKKFTLEYFKNILGRTGKPIKLVIMDQEKLAGVGNIYANEALFAAGIDPRKPAKKLSDKETADLREAIIKILNEAIVHKGSSDKDEAYRQITGEKGSHQNYILVYGRLGQPCPKCGSAIKRIALGGRGTFYCPACQK